MRKNRLSLHAFVGVLVLAALGWTSAWAQDWPVRPVRVVLPFTPGGSSDFVTRLVTEDLTGFFKQPFVVDSRPGAGGVIGLDAVAKSPPDGYTIAVTGIAAMIIAPAMNPANFDAMKSFSHIALLGGPPVVLVTHPSVPAKDIKELVAYSRKTPQGLSYASAGIGTQGHLVGELLAQVTGARLVHVPYKGGAQAMADLMANQVPASISTAVSVAPLVKADKIRGVAVTSAHRLSELSTIPTFAEQGLPDLTVSAWLSLSGPAGLSPGIVNRTNAEVRRLLNLPETRQKLDPQGIEPNDLSPAAFTEFVRAEYKRWTPIAEKAK